MSLCKEEIRKVLRSRMTIIVILLIMVIQISAIISGYIETGNKCGGMSEYNAYAKNYNGTMDLDIVSDEDIQKMNSDAYHRTGNTKEEFFYEQYLAAVVRSMSYADENDQQNAPRYYNALGINYLVQNLTSLVSTIFAFLALIILLHSIFFKDVENGMDRIIYSSYRGRKEIVMSKFLAGIILGLSWMTIYYFVIGFLTITIYGDWDLLLIRINCIPCLSDCNAGITVLGYLLLGYALLMVAATLMTACLMLVFSRVTKPFWGIGIGLLLVILPMFIPKNGNIGKLFCLIPSVFGSAQLIVGENLYYVISGAAIPLYAIGFILLPIMTFVVFAFYRLLFWKGRIDL